MCAGKRRNLQNGLSVELDISRPVEPDTTVKEDMLLLTM